MKNTGVSDLDINRGVRKVFVRHRVNLGWLSIGSHGGSLFVHGDLQLLPGADTELSSSMVTSIFKEVKRCEGITRTTVELNNWIYDSSGDSWRPRNLAAQQGGKSIIPMDQVFDVQSGTR